MMESKVEFHPGKFSCLILLCHDGMGHDVRVRDGQVSPQKVEFPNTAVGYSLSVRTTSKR